MIIVSLLVTIGMFQLSNFLINESNIFFSIKSWQRSFSKVSNFFFNFLAFLKSLQVMSPKGLPIGGCVKVFLAHMI